MVSSYSIQKKHIPMNCNIFIVLLFSLLFFSSIVASAEAQQHNRSSNQPLVIESQVKGSQEQPKVIYIMPWQGVDKVIEVKGKKRTIELPHFKPINPRVFKEQVRFFADKEISLTSGVAKPAAALEAN